MNKPRIMLIDDESGFANLLKLNLEETGGFEVLVEDQGTRAAAAARQFQPDLIFLDVIMPDVDGTHVAAQIRGDPSLKDTPIVFLTAIVSKSEMRTHGSIIGGNDFLAKPVDLDEVLACIEKYLGTRRGVQA